MFDSIYFFLSISLPHPLRGAHGPWSKEGAKSYFVSKGFFCFCNHGIKEKKKTENKDRSEKKI